MLGRRPKLNLPGGQQVYNMGPYGGVGLRDVNYCTACGSQLPAGVVYCPVCGLAVGGQQAPLPTYPSGSLNPAAPPPNPEPSHDEEGWQKSPVPLSSPQTSGLRLALSILGLVGFGLLLVAITIAWIF